jgi:hypothetical protein
MTKEALKLTLEALERCVSTCFDQYAHEQVMSKPEHFVNQTITAIREALAQPVQHREGHWCADLTCSKCYSADFRLKHTAPPLPVQQVQEPDLTAVYMSGLYDGKKKRPWVGLTDEDLKLLSDKWRIVYGGWVEDFAKEIEQALKEKNT